eukprot:5638264-Pleurochrysis_carterae.AAC.6
MIRSARSTRPPISAQHPRCLAPRARASTCARCFRPPATLPLSTAATQVQVLQKHDAARVLQSCYRLGTQAQRDELMKRVKGERAPAQLRALTQSGAVLASAAALLRRESASASHTLPDQLLQNRACLDE